MGLVNRAALTVGCVVLTGCLDFGGALDACIDAGLCRVDGGLPTDAGSSDAGAMSPDSGLIDAGSTDAGARTDAGSGDAGSVDGGSDAGLEVDAGVDSGLPFDAGIDAGPDDAGVDAGPTPFPSFSLTTTSIVFPDTAVTAGVVMRSVTIQNTGNVPLTALTTGVAPGNFTAGTSGCTSPLPPTGTCLVTVSFTPVEGTFTAQLTIDFAETPSQAVSLSATGFVTYTLQVALNGQGLVESNDGGLSCVGSTCTQTIRKGSQVSLSPVPSLGNGFTGWTISCSGLGACTLTMNSSLNVSASFDRLNRAFVTAHSVPGTITDPDFECTAAAVDAGLTGNFYAWLGVGGVPTSAVARLQGARGWCRVDGRPVADTPADLFAGRHLNSLNLDQTGVRDPTSYVWTGLNSDTSLATDRCTNWTSSSFAVSGQVGSGSVSGARWTEFSPRFCGSTYHLACFEVAKTVAVVRSPIPAGGRRAFVSAARVPGGTSTVGANFQCQAEAAAAGLPRASSYVALRGTSSASAMSAINLDGGAWYRVDGVLWAVPALMADAGTTFNRPQPFSPLSLYADGGLISGSDVVWTGGHPALPAGSGRDCVGWSSSSSSDNAEGGRANYNGGDSANGNDQFTGPAFSSVICNTTNALYCVEN